MDEDDAWNCNRDGYDAAIDGLKASDNPYIPGTPSHRHWANGFVEGLKRLAMEGKT